MCLPARATRSCVQPTVVSQQRDGCHPSSHPVMMAYRVDREERRGWKVLPACERCSRRCATLVRHCGKECEGEQCGARLREGDEREREREKRRARGDVRPKRHSKRSPETTPVGSARWGGRARKGTYRLLVHVRREVSGHYRCRSHRVDRRVERGQRAGKG